MHSIPTYAVACLVLALLGLGRDASAQEPPPAPSWHFLQDGVVFTTFNRQGGPRELPFGLTPRSETDFRSQNWYMAMATHRLGPGTVTLSGMLSLEPVTVGARGYSELFQVGEAYQGLENIDRQHPHDFFTQIAATWRAPLGK